MCMFTVPLAVSMNIFVISVLFGDIFGDIFGGGDPFGRRQRSNKGSDLQYSMTISLENAVRGVTEKISIPALDSCSYCGGTGAKKGTSPVTCGSCGGAGSVACGGVGCGAGGGVGCGACGGVGSGGTAAAGCV